MRKFWILGALVLGCGGDKDGTDTGTSDETDTSTEGDADTDTDTDTDTDADTDTDTVSVPPVTGDPATVTLAGECSLDTKVGSFKVDVLDTYSTVVGSIADGVVPITILEEVGAEGTCRLLKRNNPFCTPPCNAGDTCDFDGSCIPFPANQDLGTVTVGGLLEDVVMSPVQPGNQYFDVSIPHPPFSPGALVELRTHGTTYGADIELHGIAFESMSLGTDTEWTIVEGQDLQITWEPPATPGRAIVQLQLNIDQHGNTPVQLFCDLPDTGAAAIPHSLVDQLISFGVTGFPNATLTRQTTDSTTMGDGCVQFQLKSPASPSVRVDGYVPCNDSGDCPTGQTCDPVIFICG